ncbi:MAG: EAL domain-containing protein [Gammaproteobacteria bacterium]|nr:EAL domain-containing protein [Gammaproteobacteria bacterium]
MNTSLRVLIVDDSEDDVLLMVRALRCQGYHPDFERVYTISALKATLINNKWDLIITDHAMPELNSNDVLRTAKQLCHDTPVIIVSGMIPEATAIAAMKAGAQDYIMKDNMVRLIPAIERELNEARSRAARKRAEKALSYLTFHDALTDLVNRSGLERRMQRALNLCQERNQHHVFLYIDLDQFKIINDTVGHIAGDEMIKQLARELKYHLRESDTLARLGGDEFGVLLENCDHSHAKEITQNLLKLILEFRFNWQGKIYQVSASIGFVEIKGESINNVDDVLGAADVACYTAKNQGGNRIKEYHKNDSDMAKHYGEMQWVCVINQALEENRFSMYVQGIFPASGNAQRLQYGEFLLRLIQEDGRVQCAGDFIPAAERYNLMPKIDRWVVGEVFSYLAVLLTDNKIANNARYFINISGASLSDSLFYTFIREKLKTYQIPPGIICFEVTETAAIAHLHDAVEFINQIKSLGCHFALDDFGAGLSSFTYLRTIPVDFIKIDGAFVTHMREQPMDRAIIESINQIGHIAGMQTIAEFVENEETKLLLRHIGVDFVQGYGLDHPQPLAVNSTALSVVY